MNRKTIMSVPSACFRDDTLSMEKIAQYSGLALDKVKEFSKSPALLAAQGQES